MNEMTQQTVQRSIKERDSLLNLHGHTIYRLAATCLTECEREGLSVDQVMTVSDCLRSLARTQPLTLDALLSQLPPSLT